MVDGFNVAAAAVFFDLQSWTTREGAAVNKMESWASIVASSCGRWQEELTKGSLLISLTRLDKRKWSRLRWIEAAWVSVVNNR